MNPKRYSETPVATRVKHLNFLVHKKNICEVKCFALLLLAPAGSLCAPNTSNTSCKGTHRTLEIFKPTWSHAHLFRLSRQQEADDQLLRNHTVTVCNF